jgi:dihydropyrimidinase
MAILIRGGTAVDAMGARRADILADKGAVAAVGENLESPTGAEVIDAGGCLVMPGGIDPHTHMEFRFMGMVTADDFEWGTKAALAGGTTTIVDMCVPEPGQKLSDAYQDWRTRSKKAAGDYGYHMSITWWSDEVGAEMETCVNEYGINSFKHFMAYKGALMVDDDILYRSFRRCADLGAIALVHAENGDLVWHLQQEMLARGIKGPEAHSYSRPVEVEGEAANRAVIIAEAAGCRLYVVHTSCAPAHAAIARARARGLRVYGEPLAQHLVLTDAEYRHPNWDHAAQRVMSPPFRAPVHNEDLWHGLQSGSLQVVASDHCAFTTEQKSAGRNDFTKIPNGTGGLEDRMAVVWTAGVRNGRLTPSEFVAVVSTNIARILNIYPQKGSLQIGADADLVIWDPAATKTISARTQISRIDYNVFEGFEATGLPRVTLLRGAIAWMDGDIRAKAGQGRYLSRPPLTPEHEALTLRRGQTRVEAVAR